MQAPDTDNLDKLYALIKDIKFAMLTTVDAQGHLRSRPMGTMEAEQDGHIWFCTALDSAKIEELRREHRVNLSYAAPHDNRYVSVSGVARLVDRMATLGPGKQSLDWALGFDWAFTPNTGFFISAVLGAAAGIGLMVTCWRPPAKDDA